MKAASKKRVAILFLRLTKGERVALRAAAEKAAMSVPDWMRGILFKAVERAGVEVRS